VNEDRPDENISKAAATAATAALGLSGKNAIVTGASRGIGEGIARAFTNLGVNIVGVGRNFPEDWSNRFSSSPARVRKLVGDVTDPMTAKAALETCLDSFGKIDILVNNAGIVIGTDILNLKFQDWDRQMDTNVKACVYFAKTVAPEMIRQGGGGSIINISSVAADLYEGGLLAYATTKGAIASFTRGLAMDLAPHAITVNAVAPGWVNTQMGAGSLTPEQLAKVNERIPLGRVASVGDIAGTVVFLASGLSRYITGQTITVDGGQTVYGTIKGIQY
jgi:NAD(P)-dependent dehydrogenase (short-subunit alcohol dehydrogenase family)